MNFHTIKAFVLNGWICRAVTGRVVVTFLTFLLSLPSYGQKSLKMEDATYEPQIHTVLCYSLSPGPGVPAAVTKVDVQNIVLEFDDLQEDRNNYYARLIHCNYDWTKSTLHDLDIMRDYNEFPINDYMYSMNTYSPYVHYRFALPRIKLPGNYLLVVYRNGDKTDLILSRRVLIYQDLMSLAQEDNMTGLGNLKSTNQALNFTVNYSRMEVLNPSTSVHLMIRQNLRWDNARTNVQPTFIREDIKQIEYRFFDMNQSFSAGNEFRFVDFRSLNSPGINTDHIDRTQRPPELYVAPDAPRSGLAYTQMTDKDGAYVIENLDNRQEPWVSCNYINVNFTLRAPQLNEDVFVIGSFNAWQQNDENRMTWNNGFYSARLFLKQGFYDYQYWVRPSGQYSGNYFEGNHFQTENRYEVLVYYRTFQPNADILVGYFVIPVNPR